MILFKHLAMLQGSKWRLIRARIISANRVAPT